MKDTDIVEKRINDLSQYAQHSLLFVEAKHGAFVALCLVLAIGIIENFMHTEPECVCRTVVTFVALLFLIASLCTSLWAFYPTKTRKPATKTPAAEDTLFRCENIECFSLEQLMERLSQGAENHEFDSFQKQKINHIIIVSVAAARKYRLFRNALKLFAIFTLLFVIMLLINFL